MVNWHRYTFSLLGGTLVVLTLLLVGLKLFYRDELPGGSELEAFEVELLSPEEAARLLGEQPRRSLPEPPVAAPGSAPNNGADTPDS